MISRMVLPSSMVESSEGFAIIAFSRSVPNPPQKDG
jgi:hypothetical protein